MSFLAKYQLHLHIDFTFSNSFGIQEFAAATGTL